MKNIIMLFLFFLSFDNLFAQKNKIDSLQKIILKYEKKNLFIKDTTYIKILNQLSLAYIGASLDSMILFAQKASHLAKKVDYKDGYIESQINLGEAFRYKSDYIKSLQIFLNLIQILKKNKKKVLEIDVLYQISSLYYNQDNNDLSLKYAINTLDLSKKYRYDRGLMKSYNLIGNIYDKRKEYNKSLMYHQKSLVVSKQLGISVWIAIAYNNSAYIHKKQHHLDSALTNFEQALKIARTFEIGGLLSEILAGFSEIYLLKNDLSKSLIYANEALLIAQKVGNKLKIQTAYLLLYEINKTQKNYKDALKNFEQYQLYKDTIQNISIQNKTNQIYFEHESEQKVASLKATQAKQILTNKLEKENQQKIFGIIFLFLMLSAIGLSYTIFVKQKANTSLRNQKKEIQTQSQSQELQSSNNALNAAYDQLHKKNKDIHDSIKVAQRIQNALLPSLNAFEENFKDFFLLYMPKDVVSGDFYWFTKRKNTKIIVVADCTGHGAPGALLSMMGMQLLDKIVNENRILEPKKILQILHWELTKLLKQKESQTKEGMDMSVIAISEQKENIKLDFSGAMNPIYIVQNKELQDIKADKKGIGGTEEAKEFSEKSFEISPKTTIYLFSDGYQDQFGGEKNKKFMVGNFKKLLIEISEKPMQEQGEILEKTIQDRINIANEKQTDDITVLGIRI